MKNENEFNAYLSKQLRMLHGQGLFHHKASDKFASGVSDFLIWYHGRSMVIETKFIKTFPKDGNLLLDHTFTGAQQTWLESQALAGTQAYGLVAVGDLKRFYLIGNSRIPLSGNWKTSDFIGEDFKSFHFNEVETMIDYTIG